MSDSRIEKRVQIETERRIGDVNAQRRAAKQHSKRREHALLAERDGALAELSEARALVRRLVLAVVAAALVGVLAGAALVGVL